MSFEGRSRKRGAKRTPGLRGLVAVGLGLGFAALGCDAGRGREADRNSIVDLSARWAQAVAGREATLAELVSSGSRAHYRKLKQFALHADSVALADLYPTDQLQALFFRSMIESKSLEVMSPREILVFAVEQGMIGSDLRRSDELREVVVHGDFAQGRLYKFGRDDRADRSLQYFVFENGSWRVDLRGELERLREDFEAFVIRSRLSPEEAAFFILEARLFRKVIPADFVPPLGMDGGDDLLRGSVSGDRKEDLALRVIAIRESLDEPGDHAVAIEDRRESLRHVLRLGDALPPAPRFVLSRFEEDRIYLRAGSELLTLGFGKDHQPLDQRLAEVSQPTEASSSVSLLEQAERGAGREGLMAQWRNVGLRGRPQLLQQAWLNPLHGPGGQMLGLKVRKLVPGSFWHQIGLEEDDVLTRFNGLTVDSTNAWREVLNAAETDLEIEIEVERAGRSMRFRTRTIHPTAPVPPRFHRPDASSLQSGHSGADLFPSDCEPAFRGPSLARSCSVPGPRGPLSGAF